MGDRISISFKDENEESVVLFDHWAGMKIKSDVKKFISALDEKYEKSNYDPITRREASCIMPIFIAWYAGEHGINYSVYLGKTENDGDNSDNGHHVFNLVKGTWD